MPSSLTREVTDRYESATGFHCHNRLGRLCAYNFAGQTLVTNEWLHFMVMLEEPGMKP